MTKENDGRLQLLKSDMKVGHYYQHYPEIKRVMEEYHDQLHAVNYEN